MIKVLSTCVVILSVFGVSACSNMSEQTQRALSGGAMGAAGGAAIGALAGGSILGGALIGSAAGSLIGAVTTPKQVSVKQ